MMIGALTMIACRALTLKRLTFKFFIGKILEYFIIK
jgi:hypothetical protein